MSDTQQKTTKKKATTPASAQTADDTVTAGGATIWQRMGANPRLRPIVEFLLVQLPVRLEVVWSWIKDNKVKLIWTAILVATVFGAGISVYIWRRELEALAGLIWDKVWGKVWGWLGQRWGRQTVVIVAESVSQDGVKRVVKKAAEKTSGNGTGA